MACSGGNRVGSGAVAPNPITAPPLAPSGQSTLPSAAPLHSAQSYSFSLPIALFTQSAQSPAACDLDASERGEAACRQPQQKQCRAGDRALKALLLLVGVAALAATAIEAPPTVQIWSTNESNSDKSYVDSTLVTNPSADVLGNLRGINAEVQQNSSRRLDVSLKGCPIQAPNATVWSMLLGAAVCATVGLMMHEQMRDHPRCNARQPPSWSPEREANYSFRNWTQDLMAWSILATDMDGAQQTAALILQLVGAARDLARNLNYQERTTGGVINGQQVDPVTYLLSHLATHFAPLGEESRLSAISELMQFSRNSNEPIDSMLARFLTLRFRASQGGNGVAMSWEGYSWLLLRACGINQHQLLNVLQPYQGRFPSTEAEFNAMQLTLRRMGHILEHTPGNIASQLRAAPTRNFFAGEGDQFGQPQPNDPWSAGPDPWSSSAAYNARSVAANAYAATGSEQDSGTDSDTISSLGEQVDHSDPALAGLTPNQIDEHLFWAYEKAKSRWRKHMHKAAHKVRKFLKRSGKGKGKGKRRFSFLADYDDDTVDHVFYGGKGKSKGKPRSSAKGKGRRRNPIGRDGEVMKCGICESENHFRAQCPQGQSQTNRHGHAAASSSFAS